LSENQNGTEESHPARRRDRRFGLRVLAVLVGMFVVGYAVMALLMILTAPRRSVATVPDVRWMPVPQARGALEAAELKLEVGDSISNPTVAAGAVVAQTPLPGQEVGPGSRVRVILSSGPSRRTVPDVSMLSREQATRVLEATGFKVVVSETKNLRAAGRVLGTEPRTGATLPIAATVQLLVSAGPPLVAVPALLGRSEGQVAALLDAAGLRSGEVRHVFDFDTPPGEVLSQNPAPGDSVRMGSAVDFVVATRDLPGTPVGGE
jgi:serine/threonine-protein kinase